MRINQYLADTIGISRRAADKEIIAGVVRIGARKAVLGDQVNEGDEVSYKGTVVTKKTNETKMTIMLHKPYGYITSRKADETGAPTVMELLPPELQHLKPVGRLDKESDGLLLMTDDGDLLYKSTHPKFETEKEYIVTFEYPLSDEEMKQWRKGIRLIDGIAKADVIERVQGGKGFRIVLHTGLTRQIRRMAGKSGNAVMTLTRVRVGDVSLGTLKSGKWKEVA